MRTSIRTKLILLLFILITVSIFLISSQAYKVALKDMSNNAKSSTRLYAKDISNLIEERLQTIKEKTLFVAVNENSFSSGSYIIFERTPEVLAVARYFISPTEARPNRQNLFINPRYQKSETITNQSFANLDSSVDFNQALKDNEFLTVGRLVNYSSEVIVYAFPAKISGSQGIHVLVAVLIPDLVLTAVSSSSGKFVNYLVDDQGKILVHPDTSQSNKSIDKLAIFSGFFPNEIQRERTIEYTDENKQKVIGSIFKIKRSNIGIVSKILASDAYAEAEKLKVILIITSILVFIVTLIISLFFARTLIDPLLNLSKITGEIARGNFLVDVDVSSKDEIGELAQSFKKMGQELYSREQELHETQSALIQSEKMSALGQIGAGIAHEVKNPLTGILGHTQLAREKLQKNCSSSEIDSSLDIIEKETKRCKNIIENLMKFARQEKTILVEDNIGKVAKNAVALVEHQLTLNGIRIFQEIDDTLSNVMMNANQMEQVIINFMLNAQHAMEFSTKKELYVRVKNGTPGYARIEVEDTGCGMTEEIKKRIFEPFFTTKPSGKGTGLGLSVSFGIVRTHKGLIEVLTQLDKGTIFAVEMPYKGAASDEPSIDTAVREFGGRTIPKKPAPFPSNFQVPKL
ncbi:MAG: ATP-binding protein, partial [Pseudomonadota bacterium]